MHGYHNDNAGLIDRNDAKPGVLSVLRRCEDTVTHATHYSARNYISEPSSGSSGLAK